MWTGCHATDCVVRNKAFLWTHGDKWRFRRLFVQPVALLHQQRAFQFTCTLHLPEGVPTVCDTVEAIQRSHVCKQRQLLTIEVGNSQNEVINGMEAALSARLDDRFRTLLSQTTHIAETKPQR